MSILLTRQAMEQKLGQAFPPMQATSLVEVLDTFREMEVERAADTRELKQGLTALTEEVRKLAGAQRRTDERVAELAEAQRRTDERLAGFEQRVDERFAELASALTELANAQRRTEARLDSLDKSVSGLGNTFGFRLEEFVAALLPPYLERHYGITSLSLERRYFDLGGGRWEEVDLVGEGQRNGQTVTALVECHATLGGGEVKRLADKLETIAGTLGEQATVKIIVAMNIHPTAEPVAKSRGVWLVPYSRINRER